MADIRIPDFEQLSSQYGERYARHVVTTLENLAAVTSRKSELFSGSSVSRSPASTTWRSVKHDPAVTDHQYLSLAANGLFLGGTVDRDGATCTVVLFTD